MKIKPIFVAILGILFISSIIVFLNYGGSSSTNPQNTIETIKETQQTIQNSVTPPVSQNIAPTANNAVLNNYDFSDIAITNTINDDLTFLNSYETYTLLDETKLIILTKEQYTQNESKIIDIFTKYYPQDKEIPALICRKKKCNLLVTKDRKMILPQGNISYLTSYKKGTDIFWFYYVSEVSGSLTVFYSKPLFQDVKTVLFPKPIAELKEIGENSGIFEALVITEDDQERIIGTEKVNIKLQDIIK